MKKLFITCALLTVAATAHAGLDLSWGNCPPNGGVSNQNLAPCDGNGGPYQLFGNFQSPVTVNNFVALDAIIMLRDEDRPNIAGSFWDFGTCNSSGIAISDARPATCVGGSNPWGGGGSASDAFITNYVVQPDPQQARMYLTIARGATSPTTINAGTNYYAFDLQIFEDNQGACPGCLDRVAFVWNEATLFSTTDNAVVITNPGNLSQCGTANGATAANCGITPVNNKTWGSVKALYR